MSNAKAEYDGQGDFELSLSHARPPLPPCCVCGAPRRAVSSELCAPCYAMLVALPHDAPIVDPGEADKVRRAIFPLMRHMFSLGRKRLAEQADRLLK